MQIKGKREKHQLPPDLVPMFPVEKHRSRVRWVLCRWGESAHVEEALNKRLLSFVDSETPHVVNPHSRRRDRWKGPEYKSPGFKWGKMPWPRSWWGSWRLYLEGPHLRFSVKWDLNGGMWARNAALYESTAGCGKGPESLSVPSSDSNVLCTLSGVAGQILPEVCGAKPCNCLWSDLKGHTWVVACGLPLHLPLQPEPSCHLLTLDLAVGWFASANKRRWNWWEIS